MPKHGHGSVDRNRLKRRLREVARTGLLPALPPVDVVVRTLPHAYQADFGTLRDQLLRTVSRLAKVGTRDPGVGT